MNTSINNFDTHNQAAIIQDILKLGIREASWLNICSSGKAEFMSAVSIASDVLGHDEQDRLNLELSAKTEWALSDSSFEEGIGLMEADIAASRYVDPTPY